MEGLDTKKKMEAMSSESVDNKSGANFGMPVYEGNEIETQESRRDSHKPSDMRDVETILKSRSEDRSAGVNQSAKKEKGGNKSMHLQENADLVAHSMDNQNNLLTMNSVQLIDGLQQSMEQDTFYPTLDGAKN